MEILDQFWSILYANSTSDYLTALIVFLGIILILYAFKFIILKKLQKLSKKTKSEVDDIMLAFIDGINWQLYVLLAIFISLKLIVVPNFLDQIINWILGIGIVYYVVRALQHVIDFFIKRAEKTSSTGKSVDAQTMQVVGRIMKWSLWVLAIIFLLGNLGINITPLLAGVGVGGIAIAFALQTILEDLFASVSIYLDKPFTIGDFIVIGENSGIVKHIGVKSTRIQTLQGEELVVSNRELTEVRVHNYKKLEKRRVVINYGVTYDTPNSKLKKIPTIVSKVINRQEQAEHNRTHFKNFGQSSLEFETVFFIDSSEYIIMMDNRQEINLGIKAAFEKEGIEIAYPTQTLYLHKA
jgi:small-conductance mechanosensitive channel